MKPTPKTFLLMIGLWTVFFLGLAYFGSQDYEDVPATVTNVRELCYLQKREVEVIIKTVTTTDPGPCDIATFLADNNPDYDGFLVIRRTYVSFTYASPADGRQHAGRYELPRGDTGARYRIGGQFNIRAHKEKPEETRRI